MDFNDSVLGLVLLVADPTVEGCVLVVVTVSVVDLVHAHCKKNRGQELPSLTGPISGLSGLSGLQA